MKKITKILMTFLFVFGTAVICFPQESHRVINAESSEQLQLNYSKLYGSEATDALQDIAETSDGGSISVGYTNGNIKEGSNIGLTDGWVLKVDTNGNEQWSHQYGTDQTDMLSSVIEMLDGSYIVVGYTYGSLEGNNNFGTTDGWIAKLDNAGNIVWSYQYGTSELDVINAVQETTDGGIVIAGYTAGSPGVDANSGAVDGWIMKLDANGDEIWTHLYGGSETDALSDIVEVPSGGYIVSGYTTGEISSTPTNGAMDGWLLKIDDSGNEVWSRQYGSMFDDIIMKVALTSTEEIIATGYTSGNLESNESLNGAVDGWAMKVDKSGNEMWSHQYGKGNMNVLQAIDIFEDDILLAGLSTGENNSSKSAGWILKIDSLGNEIWSKTYRNDDISKEGGFYSLANTKDGILVAGLSNGNTEESTNPGDYSGWVMKFNSNYNLQFDNNGGDGEMDDISFSLNETKALPLNAYEKTDYEFIGWATTQEDANNQIISYENGSNYTQTTSEDEVLFAVWKPINPIISEKSEIEIYVGDNFTLIPNIDGQEAGNGWIYDSEYLDATFNSPATFTGRKQGTTTIVFTAYNGGKDVVNIKIIERPAKNEEKESTDDIETADVSNLQGLIYLTIISAAIIGLKVKKTIS